MGVSLVDASSLEAMTTDMSVDMAAYTQIRLEICFLYGRDSPWTLACQCSWVVC